MKTFVWIILLMFTGVLAGCKPVAEYAISEQDVSHYLQQHARYEKQMGIPGMADARITLRPLHSQVGAKNITLSGQINVAVTATQGPQTATVHLTLIAEPVFSVEKGAVLLKISQLTLDTVEPAGREDIVRVLMPYLKQSLTTFFEQQPVYVLEANKSPEEAQAKMRATGVAVKPGQLVFTLSD
ncbi:lipoprotein [Yersinia intermedia]|uniref:lipoprotein n=1 Tax=Yersinia intermedia TaxID=631 RepID=UPI0022FEE2CF|nr:lipoprotein [Yersinia intermedia]MDA5483348.1 lipoprotein [Yersinia intermedia]